MLSPLILVLLLSVPFVARGEVTFSNEREGKSLYQTSSSQKLAARAQSELSGDKIKDAFSSVLKNTEENKVCSFSVLQGLTLKLQELNPSFNSVEGSLHYLRTEDQMDDVILRQLLLALKLNKTKINTNKNANNLVLPRDRALVSNALDILSSFEEKMLKNSCLDEAYKNLYQAILKIDKKIGPEHLEALFLEAYSLNEISFEIYDLLEKSRTNELNNSGLSIKNYLKKMKSLRTQSPLRDTKERSQFVTKKVDDQKVSRRQQLYDSYSDLQILLMANIIKKLRVRLESTKAEILIYNQDKTIETVVLDPMERFRLAIKLLRKEMSLISLNTYFAGRTPSYIDLMTASYEVGIIPATELEEVAGLKDLWDVKKTFWQKASTWIRTLSSVATIALPAGYGFIPALAVVVIELTVGKTTTKTEDPSVLF